MTIALIIAQDDSKGNPQKKNMMRFPTPAVNTRIGFHYFPDSLHYRETDLRTWLPVLRALGASWVTLIAPVERAIPEFFLKELITAGIEPVLHLIPSFRSVPNLDEMHIFFQAYASWGVHYLILFDRPNTLDAWGAGSWSQDNLVERFLDIYLPFADGANQAGLTPIFSPLEPGGDFWDTAFLSLALQGMERRESQHLLDNLVLCAYAQPVSRSLNWGAGGPERWPGAKPYTNKENTQDQRGFRIFDWYLTIAQSILGRTPPIILLGTGNHSDNCLVENTIAFDDVIQVEQSMEIASSLTGAFFFPKNPISVNSPPQNWLEPIPPEVMACTCWLLSASADSPQAPTAWFQPNGKVLPVANALKLWMDEQRTYGLLEKLSRVNGTIVATPRP